jgi:hypothetical protein
MLAQNKAEEDARREQTMLASVMSTFSRHPDVSPTTTVGQPTLQEQDLVSAKDLVQAASRAISPGTAEHSVSATAVKDNATTENQPAPRSDDAPKVPAGNAAPGEAAQPDPNELTPTAANVKPQDTAPDPNELTPNVPHDAGPAEAPGQVNELGQDGGTKGGGAAATAGNGSGQDLATDEMISSSKHKKKKGLERIIPGK